MKFHKKLNITLKINSAFSVLSGIDFIFFDRKIIGILSENDLGTLMPPGIMLIWFSIFVFAVSTMKNVNKYLVGSIIIMDIMWVIGSAFLMSIWVSFFTPIGLILIGVIAVIVAAFAFFQSIGLYRYLKMSGGSFIHQAKK